MKTIVVLGGTGGQGGSVIKSFLNQPDWKIRTITRDPTSSKAQELAQKGVEVVKADIDDKDSLTAAFKDATAIYAVTDFWRPFLTKLSAEEAQDLEVQGAKNIVDVALTIPTLEHFVWSTLESAEKASGGKVQVPHFDGKGKIDDYIKSTPLLAKTTFLWVAFYAANLHWQPLLPTKLIQGKKVTYAHLQPTSPNTPIIFVDHDTAVGPVVFATISQPEKTLGKYVWATNGEVYTIKDYFALWAEVAGVKDIKYIEVTTEAYETLYGKLGLEIESMYRLWEKFGINSGKGIVYPADLGVTGLKTLKEYLQEQDWSVYL